MPFEKSREALEQVFLKTVQDDTVQAKLAAENYGQDDLLSDVLADSDSIWEGVASEIRNYDQTEGNLSALEAQFLKEFPQEISSAEELPISLHITYGLFAAGIILYAIFILFYSVYSIYAYWGSIISNLYYGSTWLRIALFLLPIGPAFGVIFLIDRIRTWRQANWADERSDALAASRSDAKLDELQERFKTQRDQIDALLSTRMQQQISLAINFRTKPSYGPQLKVERPSGFGEVSDGRFAVHTPARKRLEFLLDNLSGASIGIAGSRGAGKTTLLRNFCGPKRAIDTLKGKPVLGVLVSAPVAYQAREFLLYLFSATCQCVIEAEGGQFTPPVIDDDLVARRDGLRAMPELRDLPIALIRFGVALLAVGIVLSFFLAVLHGPAAAVGAAASDPAKVASTGQASPAPIASPAGAATPPSVQPLAATIAPVPSPASAATPALAKPRATPTLTAPATAAASATVSAGDPGAFAARWIGAMKLDPGPVLSWGGILVVLGLLLGSIVRSSALATFIIALPSLRSLTRFLPNRVLLDRQELLDELVDATYPFQRYERPEPESVSQLQREAATWLRTIKFQQSFTSGWSGSLKLPVGLEGGVSRAVTLAQNQLSLPEIASFFARFIEQSVSAKYQVIIGIDELDKLATDELARQFINDTKSIFGIERCFYLVSVSENAMSSFERRGLPIRDEFDSAFDELIYVDHLKFGLATKLLEQRILGRPVPFFALSYCMSGGLPRDLIRNFRNILEISAEGQSRLSGIGDRLLSDDIVAKARAIGTATRKVSLEPQVDRFLEALNDIENSAKDHGKLGKLAQALLKPDYLADKIVLPEPAPTAAGGLREASLFTPASDERNAKVQQLRDLAEEIATYIQFIVALRRFFNDKLKKDDLTRFIESGYIDEIAQARRYLGVNPAITRAILTRFSMSREAAVGRQPAKKTVTK